jgi:hypothetical protein
MCITNVSHSSAGRVGTSNNTPPPTLQLSHCSGIDVMIDPLLHRVTKAFKLIDKYDDFGASFLMPPLPPFRCMDFFDEKTFSPKGPYALKGFRGKNSTKMFAAYCTLQHGAWVRELAAVKSSGSSAAAKTVVKDRNDDKKNAALTKARAAAKVVMAEKRSRRAITLR